MLQAIAKAILKIGGWEMAGELPAEKRAVVIAVPHTSNWDGFWALVYKVAAQLDIHFFAKQSLFWFPLNILLRALGGVPLDRKRAGSAVDRAIEMFRTNDSFYFGLAPEGTRSRVDHWKSGFYRIAEGADVPVVLGFLDYGKRQIGIGPTLKLSGDWHKDLDFCRDFYSNIEGRWPEKAGPVTFPADPRLAKGRKKKATR
ncbi:MAG: 1-acyl-sn-glycerol-3-phosphate acyltransferase [Gammaproteobacteria bacterium]|jgi:1-acyl-sn-glycerol-3-phosphate acyltransferase|nr:1-acyl-sn-glycerol-3-phosphate acyltransferase [Gammaproteobacteria bacterium]MDH3758667.1 1-acyl-sn-glycerol-3-phosphate acyltransferase [Gammaproteobacteria bacterium]MDH3863419.1 1-acyl-sn-glycerol-3-phosphate acyltransferase [Gammaproteobacteria bacterium]MDH3906085.1 1-acyl-sn-glycerol-3-phosphate acyltransferase [Gammaproteobacteria bacterium]MDH4004394.1 1-acyl-sn-glycerol-3-phosphate acyltransferase [Gammaproteobacteria bacterium]